MSKTATQIIATATEQAREIVRVAEARKQAMKTAASIVDRAAKQSTQNVDRLFKLANDATAAANAARDINSRAYRDATYALEMVRKARRTAAAYKAAAARAAYTAEAVAKREAAAEARVIVEDAYDELTDVLSENNRAMNAAIVTAREVVKTAKLTASVEKAREIVARYPETSEADIADTIRRELDTRTADIDAVTSSWIIAMLDNATAAAIVAKQAEAEEAERAAVEAIAADMFKEHGNEEDARNAAAYGVFADLHNGASPDTLSNKDMAQLDRLMIYAADAVARAAHAERQQEATAAARIAAAAVVDAYAAAEAIRPADVTPEQSAAAYAVAAVEIIPEADRPAGYTTATDEDRATVDAMTERIAQAAADDMPTGEAPIYQRYELETYLGEYVEEYDVNAIEHEATAYDPITGRIVWTASGDDLATICARHELVKEA